VSTPYSPTNFGGKIITPGNVAQGSLIQSDISRILPRQQSTGVLRGTQSVGYGDTKIDASNNRIVLGSSAGTGNVGSIVLDGNSSSIVVSTNVKIDGTTEQISVSSGGNEIITMGKYTDGTFNFRIQDTNGIGIAQFGQFPSGPIALKVAQAGIEVSTATPQQLVFSSSASFTVAKSGTFTFPSQVVPAGTTIYATSQVIPHGAAFKPAIGCYAPLEVGGAALPVFPPDFPTNLVTFVPNGGLIYQGINEFMAVYYGVNATNIYLGMSYINDTGSPLTILGAPVTYYAYTYNAS
jgi:hypothetical protein